MVNYPLYMGSDQFVIETAESPERLTYEGSGELKPGVKEVQRIDLRELPLDTVLQFHGIHSDATYICKVVGPESSRQIKIWYKGRDGCAVTSIDTIGSWDDDWKKQEGIMKVYAQYMIPYFEYDRDRNLRLNFGEGRIESYTQILVKTD